MTDKKGFILNHQDFEPFGPEWEKEMMKLPKKAIIDLYRRACQEVPVSLPSANEDQIELWQINGWILSREKMPDVDGEYLIYGWMHTECGNVYPFQKVATCRFNQWVKSDVGEQMTYWRPLLLAPVQKDNFNEFITRK